MLHRHRSASATAIWLEAESIQVGRCRIPKPFFDQMQLAPVLEIQRSLEERVQQLVNVYGHQGGEALAEATERISRRLGPQRTQQALDAIRREDWAEAAGQRLITTTVAMTVNWSDPPSATRSTWRAWTLIRPQIG